MNLNFRRKAAKCFGLCSSPAFLLFTLLLCHCIICSCDARRKTKKKSGWTNWSSFWVTVAPMLFLFAAFLAIAIENDVKKIYDS